MEDPLEEEMATPSSILAWEKPWTEEPSRLESTGSNTSDRRHTHTQVFVGGENRAVDRVLKKEKKHLLSSEQRLQALGVLGARPMHNKTRG